MSEKKNIRKLIGKLLLGFCNVSMILTLVLFTVFYTRSTQNTQEKLTRDSFCDTMETMKQISQNHLNSEVQSVADWSAYISASHMTLDEAIAYIQASDADGSQEAHFVDPDTLAAKSTRTVNGSNEIKTYYEFSVSTNGYYNKLISFLSEIYNGDRSILGKYRVIESQRQVIAVGTRVTLKQPDDTDKDFILLRIVPVDQIKKLWIFPANYPSAEVGLITTDYDYVIPSYSMRSENFIEFIRYYNFPERPDDADETLSQMKENENGLMTLKDSRSRDCYWYYSKLGGDFPDMIVLGYIPVSALDYEGDYLFVVMIVTGILLFLSLINGLYILNINRRLKKSAEIARQANDSKTRFLSTMSHDIRTPLNAVLGMTELAQTHINDSAYVRECLRKITVSGNHLLTLINDILDISRVESGRIAIKPEPFAVNDFVAGLESITRSQAVGHGLDLEVSLGYLPDRNLIGDKLRLTQIYLNLLNNAIKYTPSGGQVRLTFSEESLSEGKTTLVCVIADTGNGMSAEFQKTMYDSFTRSTDSRIDKIQGSGLGLAIVKRLVTLMNGTIDCESAVGKGTTFTVKIPLEVSETGDAEQKAVPTTPVNDDYLRGLHILIAEDNDINWEIISMMLGEYGVQCKRAENGRICVNELTSSAPDTYDLVLMDVQRPLLNGLDATKEIRGSSREDLKHIPVIAMTADAFAEDIQRCIDAGMDAHVSKPIEIDKVLTTIRLILSRKNNAEVRR